jgi:FKBP-type peptidyl-prolyl cis-trans isomerase
MRSSYFLLLLVFVAFACNDLEDPNAAFNKEVKAIDDYLAENSNNYIVYDGYGIRLEIHRFGTMPPPLLGQNVKATVTGSVFTSETSFANVSFNSKLDSVGGDGLQYAMSLLMGGSSATIYIPSKYGFGSEGTTDVPPNSILAYDVDLKETFRTDTQQTQFELDTAAIATYLKSNSIEDFYYHPSGLFYTIEEEGSGDFPVVYDNVTFTYSGTLLEDTTAFDSGTLTNFYLLGLIDGFKVGIPLLPVGSVATLYIPSGLGYGVNGSGNTIPMNANLKFKVEVKSIDRTSP